MKKETILRVAAVFVACCLVAAFAFFMTKGTAAGDVSMDDIKKNMAQANEIKKINPGTGGNAN